MADEQAAAANERGEVTVLLDGVEWHLRPSFTAISTIEQTLGRSLFELAEDARRQRLSISDMATITAACMNAYGAANPNDALVTSYTGAKAERIGEMIYEAGALSVWPRIMVVLLQAVTGGVDASGEVKPAT